MKFRVHSRMPSLRFGLFVAAGILCNASARADAQRPSPRAEASREPGSAAVEPGMQMTVREARRALGESFRDQRYYRGVTDVKINRQRASYTGTWTPLADQAPAQVVACFENFPDEVVVIRGGLDADKGYIAQWRRRGYTPASYYFRTEARARTFVAALVRLKEAALAPSTEAADFALFAAEAQLWLSATPKPPMSDDARTFKAVAEDAYTRKDFSAALDAYFEALDRHPMWPEGQFNAALLAAEAEDFEAAAMHMRRYLALAPDAADAPAAKDRLLLWQHRAKQQVCAQVLSPRPPRGRE